MTCTPLDDLGQYDAVLIVTDHTSYDYRRIVAESRIVVDTRNATKGIAGCQHRPLLAWIVINPTLNCVISEASSDCMDWPEQALPLLLDEQSQIYALDRTQPACHR